MSAFFTHREIPYEEVAAFALDGVFFRGEQYGNLWVSVWSIMDGSSGWLDLGLDFDRIAAGLPGVTLFTYNERFFVCTMNREREGVSL
jgi:hypothetical protein